MATKEAKKPAQSLLSLMRSLRPMLPGEVKKLSATEYLVDNKVYVELSYWCTWQERKNGESTDDIKARLAKECHPNSITVKVRPEYLREQTGYGPSTISQFRCRVLQRRKDGSFNLESVATAVTKCSESMEQWIKEHKAKIEHKKKIKEAAELELEHVHKELPSVFKLHDKAFKFIDSVCGEVEVALCRGYMYDNESEVPVFEYRLDLERLTPVQIVSVLTALRIPHAKSDTPNPNGSEEEEDSISD